MSSFEFRDMRRSKRKGKRNGKSKKQPKVGWYAYREHANKYAKDSKHKHNCFGVRED